MDAEESLGGHLVWPILRSKLKKMNVNIKTWVSPIHVEEEVCVEVQLRGIRCREKVCCSATRLGYAIQLGVDLGINGRQDEYSACIVGY
jgi:hypothetical protein